MFIDDETITRILFLIIGVALGLLVAKIIHSRKKPSGGLLILTPDLDSGGTYIGLKLNDKLLDNPKDGDHVEFVVVIKNGVSENSHKKQ